MERKRGRGRKREERERRGKERTISELVLPDLPFDVIHDLVDRRSIEVVPAEREGERKRKSQLRFLSSRD